MRVRFAHHPTLAWTVANLWRGFDDWVNNQTKLPLFQHAAIQICRCLCHDNDMFCWLRALVSITEPCISVTAREFDAGLTVIYGDFDWKIIWFI
jgi:hypothetical protein